MAKFKFKISSGATNDEVIRYLDELKNFRQNEISFNHIVRIAEILGFELQLKKGRGRGSQERFFHKSLLSHKYYKGYVGVHIIHKGGDKVLVLRVNYKKYLDKPFRAILRERKK